MRGLEEEGRQAFTAWLRTGHWPARVRRAPEVKHNPWHDLLTGRFTFAGRGRRSDDASTNPKHERGSAGRPSAGDGTWQGGGFTGGGGGSFGGAGASAWWGDPEPPRSGGAGRAGARRGVPPHLRPTPAPIRPPRPHPLPAQRGAAVAAPHHSIRSNGYAFELDAANRTVQVEGPLSLGPTTPRSPCLQREAGGSDRRGTDDGGHYIARRFNGPREAFNHFAQDRNFNRGGYRALEDRWDAAKRAGKSVTVTITPRYSGTSKRPTQIEVISTIDGAISSRRFPNEHKDMRHDRKAARSSYSIADAGRYRTCALP